MLRAIASLAVLAVASAAQAQVRDTSATRPTTGVGVIRGRVTEAGTNRPLAHALVRATMDDPRVEKLASTDAGGRYELREIGRGAYIVGATKANYLLSNYGEKRPIGPGKPIDVADGQAVEEINFSLQRAGAVTGRITDEFGDPLADTQVSLMRWTFTNGERRLQPFGGGATSNDLGEFRVFNVRPGQYIVAATLRTMNMAQNPDGNGGDRSAYEPTYFPGTPNPREAQRLTVGPGQTVTGMNFGLLPVSAVHVSGTVVDSQGRTIANGSVNALPRTSTTAVQNVGGVRPDGKFTLTLTPGDYTLRANKNGGPMLETENALVDISVANADITDLILVTAKSSTLRGRVVFEPGDAKIPAPSTVRVTLQQVGSNFPINNGATPKDDLTFELKSTSGHVMIRAPFSTDWRLRRVTAGGVDVTDTGLDVPPNATIENIVVEVTSRQAQISVRVLDDHEQPTRDCWVVVFASDSGRWTPQTRFVVSNRPGVDGVYQPRLPAGDYLVAAFQDDNPSGLWNDPEVLAQLREHAVAVSVADGDAKKLDVKLGEPPVY